MTTETLLRHYLDIKLVDNDINIVDIILSFIGENCECCNDKVYDGLNVQCIFNSHHKEDDKHYEDCKTCFGNMDIEICDKCDRDQCCMGCFDFLCEKCDEDEYHLCSVENCNRKYCDDCLGDKMFMCDTCEEWKCCEQYYKVFVYEGDKYICMTCMKDNLHKAPCQRKRRWSK